MTKLSEKLVKLVNEREEILKKRRDLKKKTESKVKGVEYIKELKSFTEELKLINEKILIINPNFTLNFKKPKTHQLSVTGKSPSKRKRKKRLTTEQKNKLKGVIVSHNIPSSLINIDKRGGIDNQARMTLNYKKRKK